VTMVALEVAASLVLTSPPSKTQFLCSVLAE
jgi:hypothetical protein